MKTRLTSASSLLAAVFLVLTLPNALMAGRKSDAQRDADKERAKFLEKARKQKAAGAKKAAQSDKQKEKELAAKAAEEAKEKEAKAAQIAKEKEQRKQLYEQSPQQFFDAHMKGIYCADSTGAVRKTATLSGEVLQIVAENTMVLRAEGYDEPVAVRGFDTSSLAVGKRVTFRVQTAGGLSYTTAGGASKAALLFAPAQMLTFDDFKKLKEKGVDLLSFVETHIVNASP